MKNDQWGTADYRPTPGGRLNMLREHLAASESLTGRLRVVRILVSSRFPKARAGAAEPVPVPMRGGLTLHLRPGTTDLVNASSYLARAIHRPPPEASEVRRIVELGTNIGAGLSALASEHPNAELVGVEPDAANIAVARRNTAPFGDRVRLINAAVWDEDTELVVSDEEGAGAHGLTVRAASENDPPNLTRMKGRTIDSLLDEAFPGETVDYVHITIEGTEPRGVRRRRELARAGALAPR